MKKILVLLIMGVLGLSTADAEDKMMIHCEDVIIESPLGWLVQYTRTPSLFIMYSPLEKNDNFQENANLIIEALPAAYTVSEYMEASMASLESVYTNFKLLETSDMFHIVSGQFGEIPVQQIQYFFIHDDKAYVLTFSSNPENFDRYRPTFDSIAQTLSFIEE